MCLSSKSQPHELESLQIHHRLHIDLQPPVKFHDVVRIFQKPRHVFIRDTLSIYTMYQPVKLHAILTNGTCDMINQSTESTGGDGCIEAFK